MMSNTEHDWAALCELAAYEHGRRSAWREAYRAGWDAGFRRGWAASDEATAETWRPLAERVRRMAGRKTWEQILAARGSVEIAPGEYRSAPRPGDFQGIGMDAVERLRDAA